MSKLGKGREGKRGRVRESGQGRAAPTCVGMEAGVMRAAHQLIDPTVISISGKRALGGRDI